MRAHAFLAKLYAGAANAGHSPKHQTTDAVEGHPL